MVQPGSAHTPSVSTNDRKRATSATPESSLLLGVALVRVIAIAASVALRACLVPANTAGALVRHPMVAHVTKTASAISREHVRLVIATSIENSARTARFIGVTLPVIFFLIVVVLIVVRVVTRCPPARTKKHLGRLDRLLERRIQVNLVDNIAQIEFIAH